jgi:O-acetyl-ADP-ribose deacetylase (regulator of RNase III)
MLKTIKQNILEVTSGIICHQVNCKGVMGSGIALSIKNKWPVVYEQYIRRYRANGEGWFPGDIQIVPVTSDLSVCNMAGQDGYGRGEVQTDEGAVDEMFFQLAEAVFYMDDLPSIYIPYKMGCGLAGGHWITYLEIVEKYVPDAIICRL